MHVEWDLISSVMYEMSTQNDLKDILHQWNKTLLKDDQWFGQILHDKTFINTLKKAYNMTREVYSAKS